MAIKSGSKFLDMEVNEINDERLEESIKIKLSYVNLGGGVASSAETEKSFEMGLVVCLRIIADLGGRIEFHNDSSNNTVFEIILPRWVPGTSDVHLK